MSAPETKPVKLSPQTKRVLTYMVGGQKLTNLIAMTNLQIGSLSSRIAELKSHGYRILDEWSKDHWQRSYKRYFIDADEAARIAVEE